MPDKWNPEFYLNNPLFSDISSLASYFQTFSHWPDINDYNQFLNNTHHKLLNKNHISLNFVPQGEKSDQYQDGYEPRIYLKGEIQTRTQNWHDFFQVLIWNRYPLVKSHINALHYQAIVNNINTEPKIQQRSSIENTLTLFDECGAIIVSSNPTLLDLIATFKWEELFIKSRAAFNKELYCFVFGHALYEKSLSPYIGMTAHALLIEVTPDFFQQSTATQTSDIDLMGVEFFDSAKEINTRLLQPFPVLGVPGWDERNENPVYYRNKDYFRPGRR